MNIRLARLASFSIQIVIMQVILHFIILSG